MFLTFNQNHNLSLTLSEELVLPKLNRSWDTGVEFGSVVWLYSRSGIYPNLYICSSGARKHSL